MRLTTPPRALISNACPGLILLVVSDRVIGVVVALVQDIIEGDSPDIVVSELTTPYASIWALRCPRESI
ncbi:hypothetical protein, partial [Raoultella ornithinolytica]|uniref:hypothetical protein n=1 Tax=Raoultella ornithinolytica TaxID=54291 RepID=UPI001C61263E